MLPVECGHYARESRARYPDTLSRNLENNSASERLRLLQRSHGFTVPRSEIFSPDNLSPVRTVNETVKKNDFTTENPLHGSTESKPRF